MTSRSLELPPPLNFKFQRGQKLYLHETDKLNKLDLNNYLKSRKLDGYRAYWDGKHLWSKNLKRIRAPDWFTDLIPSDLRLDGELYAGEKAFEIVNSVVKFAGQVDAATEREWAYMAFMVFDQIVGPDVPFVQRYGMLKNDKRLRDNPVVQVIPHTPLIHGVREASQKELQAALQTAFNYVVSSKGEGLVLKNAMSLYQGEKKTKEMIKIKQFYESTEAVITTIHNDAITVNMTYNGGKFEKIHIWKAVRRGWIGQRVVVRWSDWVHHRDQILPRFAIIVNYLD